MARLIKPSKYHRTIDGGELLRRREKAQLTQQQIADKCAELLNRVEFSRSFICQLEHPGDDSTWHHEICVDIAVALQKILPK